MSQPEFTPVYHANTHEQAHLLKNLLEQCGIAARVVGEATVVTAVHHAGAAGKLVEDFDQRVSAARQERLGDAAGEATAEEEGRAAAARAECPQCGAARRAVCPVCGATGTEFEAADPNFLDTLVEIEGLEAATSDAPSATPDAMLICGTCDEPFRAQYARRCSACGHEFPDGVELEETPHHDVAETHVGRVALIFLALAGVLVLFALFFLSLEGTP